MIRSGGDDEVEAVQMPATRLRTRTTAAQIGVRRVAATSINCGANRSSGSITVIGLAPSSISRRVARPLPAPISSVAAAARQRALLDQEPIDRFRIRRPRVFVPFRIQSEEPTSLAAINDSGIAPLCRQSRRSEKRQPSQRLTKAYTHRPYRRHAAAITSAERDAVRRAQPAEPPPSNGSTCIACIPKKCATRRSPPSRDQFISQPPFASLCVPPTQWLVWPPR